MFERALNTPMCITCTNILVMQNTKKFIDIKIDHKRYKFAFPAGNYMFKVNNRNTRTRCEIHLN